jgi:endonuclease/exonuclease/phosphatase family metal-dependent hydrolase
MSDKNLKIKKVFIIISAVIVGLLLTGPVIFYFWASSGNIATDSLSEIFVINKDWIPETGEKKTYTVMTYNIGYLSGMMNKQTASVEKDFYDKNLQTFLNLISELKPDIIGFQEIDFHSNRSHYVDQLTTIANHGKYAYADRAINWDKNYVPFPRWPPSVHFGHMLSGQAVVSKYVVESAERIVLQKPVNKLFFYNAFYLDRLAQVVTISINTKKLIIINVHLDALDRETREEQVKVILNLYRSYKDNYAVLLLGDFNCTPPNATQLKNFPRAPNLDFTNETTIDLLIQEEGLKEAVIHSSDIIEEKKTFTFPADLPNRKIDYIFYNSNKLESVAAYVPQLDSSDHLPVVMEFKIKE